MPGQQTPPVPNPNVADFYRVQPVTDRRIHILGVGSIGRFIAHSLRGIANPPPITLLTHSGEWFKKWEESPKLLSLTTGDSIEKRGGFDVEEYRPVQRFHGKEVDGVEVGSKSTEPISTLIICTKAPVAVSALLGVRHRLGPDSVILFMQNGMGIVEEVNRDVFPDPATRPHYMLGINSHGVNIPSKAPFSAIHAGFGTIALGILPHEREHAPAPYSAPTLFTPGSKEPVLPKRSATPDEDTSAPGPAGFEWTQNSRYLLRTLLRTPVLCATAFSPPDLLQLQLEKLAVNSIINPLTVLLDARNGSILYNYYITRTMRLLLAETSLVIRSLPELQHIPNVAHRFEPGRLETMVVGVANKTRDNISSMLADSRKGSRTEIDYINAWVVKRGEELGVRCVMNYMMVNLVKGKAGMIQYEMGQDIPMVGDSLDILSEGGESGGDYT